MIGKLDRLRDARKRGEGGFTIIEVLIVLAIAGLIMLIVFLAVPALQRNSRNTSRRSDASHLAGLINEYASNHAGTLPTGYGAGAGQVDISGEKWALVQTPITANIGSNNTTPAAGTTDVLNVNKGFKCDQSTNTLTAGGGTRAFSVSFRVETSSSDAVACING
jgi:prepilin-type N-terminal cleavage/methylation domain-containing protein